MKKFIFALLFLGQGAWAQTPEVIYGFSSGRPGIFIQVFSGGCTNKEDFQILRRSRFQVSELTFVRVNPDTCLANFPYGERVYFSWQDLGLQPGDRFVIGNPLGVSQRKTD